MSVTLQVRRDAADAATYCAARIAELLTRAIEARRHATLAVSGGTTPGLLFERLATTDTDWTRIHLFWIDERAVSPDDPRSNYRLAREHLIVPAGIPEANVHRVPAELAPAEAAARYEAKIREFFGITRGRMPRIDVVHRGIGADGHTASLFPGEVLIEDGDRIAASVYVEKLAEWRITLLPGVLLAASKTVVLAVGDDKAEAVRAVFREPYNPLRYPAQLGHDRDAEWVLDEAAARRLTDDPERAERGRMPSA